MSEKSLAHLMPRRGASERYMVNPHWPATTRRSDPTDRERRCSWQRLLPAAICPGPGNRASRDGRGSACRVRAEAGSNIPGVLLGVGPTALVLVVEHHGQLLARVAEAQTGVEDSGRRVGPAPPALLDRKRAVRGAPAGDHQDGKEAHQRHASDYGHASEHRLERNL